MLQEFFAGLLVNLAGSLAGGPQSGKDSASLEARYAAS